jgi:hypothetical protein
MMNIFKDFIVNNSKNLSGNSGHIIRVLFCFVANFRHLATKKPKGAGEFNKGIF